MTDIAKNWLSSAEITTFAGNSLASTLYQPTDIFLTGELGAGKTTFLQGFLKGLGVSSHITSPTYALEQRYQSPKWGEILHIDLYRLDTKQADELFHSSNDHRGIRCIEWADRLSTVPDNNCIHIHLEEDESGVRILTISFNDIPLPSRAQIEEWRQEVMLPEHVGKHCDTVATLAVKLSESLQKKGVILRPLALKRAGEMHDLFRFVDFKEGASHVENHIPKETHEIWDKWKRQYPNMQHESVCTAFLTEHGFPGLAEIVKTHGAKEPEPVTIEQKLLYYADKRVKIDQVVTIEERFEDFKERYGAGKESKEGKIWYEEAKALEKDLGFMKDAEE